MPLSINIHKADHSRLSQVDFNNIPFGKTFSDHMFMVDYRDGEWVDAQILPYGPISFNPSMLALHYGQAIFEGMKASKGIDGTPYLFRPEMHVERLNKSAERLCMPKVDGGLFINGLMELVNLDKDWIPPQEGSALYIRPFMFATEETLGVKVSSDYRFIIFTGPVGPYYPKPVKLLADEYYVRAFEGGVGEAKAAGNYAASLLPAKKAMARGYDQVLWLDGIEHKYIHEVGTMNVFFVIGDTIVTPATDGAILRGITRDTILKLLNEKGSRIEIRPLSIDEILNAHDKGELKEVFGSGTAAVIANVSHLRYKDREIELPGVEECKVANWLKNEINSIRSGRIEDRHGWLSPVRSVVNV